MPTSISIRPATFPADTQTVRNLFLAYAQSLPIALDFQGFEEELAGLPGKYAADRGGVVYLAHTTEEGKCSTARESVIGIVALRAFPSAAVRTCELKRLYIEPAARGRGVAKTLMDAVVFRARECGYVEMLLDTLGSMTAARRLYGGYGFQEIEGYYESVEGAVFYKLVL
ncbi:acyl-CoA N-acyltransferase [Ophiobolus disseminans]|uniref:Acyl-CoA N-acyltransferase n=1 Tax=Ophiobolus disseminans TaxID=1469910 RepID=A0A6A6ZCV1_9PLEO|nr:acyl-CoA N-acyltransferase [Ophiobolus disseminans]